ncbi:MAG: hypothetical protein WAU56_07510 [Steroidobacteraceae bacterium]
MTTYRRLAPDVAPSVNVAARTADFVMSTEEPGRDGHILLTSGLQLENFLANPVCLWQHLDEEPPIGKWINVRVVVRELLGTILYAPTEFGLMILDLVAGGFLRAVSMSWAPLPGGYEPRGDTSGGLIFTAADVLECSQVSVPALPSALLTAGARGINLRPLRDWSERCLDRHQYGALDRPAVEAIFRSAGDGMRRRRGATSTLKGLGYYGGNGDTERHVKRAVRLHGKLLKHHDAAGEQVDDLDGVRTRFAALGYAGREFTRCLSDLKRCARGLRSVHTDAGDVHGRLADALENAQGSLANDDDDTGNSTGIAPYKTLSEHDTDATRAARVKRARQLALGSNDPLARSPEQALLRHQDR